MADHPASWIYFVYVVAPSFHKIESDSSSKLSDTAIPDITKESKDDVTFFEGAHWRKQMNVAQSHT